MATRAVDVGPSANAPAAGDFWSSAPFDAHGAAEVRALVARLSAAQRLWLAGYLVGAAERLPAAAPSPAGAGQAGVTVLFGSQSGNSERLANELGAALGKRGINAKLLDMLDCRRTDLERAQTLLVIVSTHGDGDPPDRALPLHELLHGRKAIKLPHVRFSVLALGDSSYEKFCATGRQFDARLEELGATRLHARTDCDVDFETAAAGWIDAVVGQLAAEPGGAPAIAGVEHAPAPVAQAHTRKNPFAAEVLVNQPLTARGSTKDVRHVELSLEGSSIHYEPGDALGIVPRNSYAAVEHLLAALPYDRDAALELDGAETPLREALAERFEIGALAAPLVQRYAKAVGASALALLADDPNALRRYIRGRDLCDLVTEHPPHGLDARAFASLLRPLAPRLYSIASSAQTAPGEVHLCVGLVEYESHGRRRQGVVSGAVAALAEGAALPVYLHRNPSFRLPADPSAPIVMIGAGTGVAPFRAFLAEREAVSAPGPHWLVFGDRSFELDFLYQSDWLSFRKRGVLTRIDVAFSRDQAHKVYVQHRLLEHGAALWSWLKDGAHLYVCGDAERLAPDVESALLDIVQTHGGLDAEAAREYLLELTRARRYQRDVY
jgi:sulfite reductase (NADPH) flavoprotein alpha-component